MKTTNPGRVKAHTLKRGDKFVAHQTVFEVTGIEYDFRAKRNKIRIRSVEGKNHAEGRSFAAINPNEWVTLS